MPAGQSARVTTECILLVVYVVVRTRYSVSSGTWSTIVTTASTAGEDTLKEIVIGSPCL